MCRIEKRYQQLEKAYSNLREGLNDKLSDFSKLVKNRQMDRLWHFFKWVKENFLKLNKRCQQLEELVNNDKKLRKIENWIRR